MFSDLVADAQSGANAVFVKLSNRATKLEFDVLENSFVRQLFIIGSGGWGRS